MRELWSYRDLLRLLVWRDFVARYKQTVLGPLWFILQPLLMTAVFTVVFGLVFNLSTDGLPPVLFYLCGQLGWNYFAQSATTSAASFVNNTAVLSKVYFPRLILPLSSLISNLFAFVIQAATFAVFFIAFKTTPKAATFGVDWHLVLLPLLVLQTAALSLGFGLLMAAVTAKYRDLTHVMSLLIQVWMYATPVIYPLSQFPARWRPLAAINPVTSIMESYRFVLLGAGTVEPRYLFWSLLTTAALLIGGLVLFGRAEKTFIDNA